MDMMGFVRAAIHVQINLCMHNSHLSDVVSLGFFGIPKVATIRLRRPYITAEQTLCATCFSQHFNSKKKIMCLDQEVYISWQHCNSLTQIHLSLCSVKAVQVSSKIKRHKHSLHCCTKITTQSQHSHNYPVIKKNTNLKANITNITYLPCSPSHYIYVWVQFSSKWRKS